MNESMQPLMIDKSHRPWWRRWLRRIGLSLLAFLVTAACTWVWWLHSAQKRLYEALNEMDRAEAAWRLENIESAREQIPEEENSARIVIAAARLLPKSWSDQKFEEWLPARDPPAKLAPEDFARLEQELKSMQPAVEIARRLATMPHGRHRIAYERLVYETLLLDQFEVRRIAHLLTCDALLHDQKQDMKAALNSCRASLNAARSLSDEPIALSQLIRSACVINTCQALERALAQGQPAPEDLALMGQSLQAEDAFHDLLIATRGERAALHATFEALESGEIPFSRLEGTLPSWWDYGYGWFSRQKFREAHPTMLEQMNSWVALAQSPMPQQAALERVLDVKLRVLRDFEPIAVLLIPALNKVAQASRRKHAYLRCMIVALAAESYRREHETWPETIDKLCPKYLSTVPQDPFDGSPLRFRRFADGVVIYSVGHDGVDNLGKLNLPNPDEPGVDVGWRLWDVGKRHQPPRPKPPQLPNPE